MRQVSMTVHIRAFHCWPISERLPCVIRRSITEARMARSAALLVGETAGSNRNRKIASPCLTSRLAGGRAWRSSKARHDLKHALMTRSGGLHSRDTRPDCGNKPSPTGFCKRLLQVKTGKFDADSSIGLP